MKKNKYTIFGIIPFLVIPTISAREQATKPNILIILADDAGYADFGFMGSNNTETPNLDRLASMGRTFSDAHVAATVSSPSRAMLLTGRYGQRFGYECNLEEGQGMPADEELLPALLKRNGYCTACIGKWHLGTNDFQHPNAKGFDIFYGLLGGSRPYFYNAKGCDKPGSDMQYQHNGTPIPFEGYFTDELTKRAKEVIAAESDQPFMLYLSYTAPHSPNQGAKADMERFKDNPRQAYAAMLYGLDRGVGEVLDLLEEKGKLENTLIFFLSDNGGSTTNRSSNLPLKGFKGNKFEGGQRVPMIIAWGDRFRKKESFDGLTSSLDVFATIVDAADIHPKELHKPIDGVSLLPYLVKGKKGDPHETLFWRKMDSRAIRSGDYKLIITQGVDTVLYNIKDQLDETENILQQEPAKAKKLLKQLARWEKDCCIGPTWIEQGWGPITNGIHKRLMHNEIKTADDMKKKK